MRNQATLILVLLACFFSAANALAQRTPDPREGIASTGLCGLANVAYPTCPERWAVAAHAGYGITESAGPVEGAHHRLAGTLGAGVVPLPWLALSLRLDGRFDLHPKDEYGKDRTGTGDPRLFVRGGYDLPRNASVGAEAVVWIPGKMAPSFDVSATTVDLKALAAWRPGHLPFMLLGHLGYRIDNSARSAPDLRRLRAGDRLALGLSDFDALLIGVGSSTRAVAQCELFIDLSLDYLVGAGAPAFESSPLRATAGGRYFFASGLQGELTTTISLNGTRRSIVADEPLLPVEPRFGMALGVRYGRPLHPAPVASATLEEPESPTTEPSRPQTASVRGVLRDDSGAPVPDVRVALTIAPETQLRETVTDAEGRYAFTDVPLGDATLAATAPGFENEQWIVAVTPNLATDDGRVLRHKGEQGMLRILTRSFSSEPLAANVLVRDPRGRKVASGKGNEQGLSEFTLHPGRYTVMISAPGYRALRREVEIERYGVAILNVDMQQEK